jgi:hypothetical protein
LVGARGAAEARWRSPRHDECCLVSAASGRAGHSSHGGVSPRERHIGCVSSQHNLSEPFGSPRSTLCLPAARPKPHFLSHPPSPPLLILLDLPHAPPIHSCATALESESWSCTHPHMMRVSNCSYSQAWHMTMHTRLVWQHVTGFHGTHPLHHYPMSDTLTHAHACMHARALLPPRAGTCCTSCFWLHARTHGLQRLQHEPAACAPQPLSELRR